MNKVDKDSCREKFKKYASPGAKELGFDVHYFAFQRWQANLLDTNQGLFYFKGRTYIAWGFGENIENFFTNRMMISEVGDGSLCPITCQQIHGENHFFFSHDQNSFWVSESTMHSKDGFSKIFLANGRKVNFKNLFIAFRKLHLIWKIKFPQFQVSHKKQYPYDLMKCSNVSKQYLLDIGFSNIL